LGFDPEEVDRMTTAPLEVMSAVQSP
jgi:hypothetical protein